MRRPATKKQLVQINVEKSLVATIDEVSQRQHRTRSDFIRQAVLKALEVEHGLCPVAA